MWSLVRGGGSRKAGPVTMYVSLQERIAKSHGTQCGFCTPGMVMSMYTLLRNHPQPSEEQLMEALGGRFDTENTHHPQGQGGGKCASSCSTPTTMSPQPHSRTPLVVPKVAAVHPGEKNGSVLTFQRNQ